MADKVEIAKAFLVGEKRVKFAYLFGSVASGTAYLDWRAISTASRTFSSTGSG